MHICRKKNKILRGSWVRFELDTILNIIDLYVRADVLFECVRCSCAFVYLQTYGRIQYNIVWARALIPLSYTNRCDTIPKKKRETHSHAHTHTQTLQRLVFIKKNNNNKIVIIMQTLFFDWMMLLLVFERKHKFWFKNARYLNYLPIFLGVWEGEAGGRFF